MKDADLRAETLARKRARKRDLKGRAWPKLIFRMPRIRLSSVPRDGREYGSEYVRYYHSTDGQAFEWEPVTRYEHASYR